MNTTAKLNNGIEMPRLGFGVYQITDFETAQQSVEMAISAGYRLIDTAAVYQNEEAVGAAIKNSSTPRSELFVTSKLWVSDFSYERAKRGIDASLERLGLDYLDLYLLHQPYGDTMGAWRALQEAYQAGKIRAIGVSNFYADQLKKLALSMPILPAVNQIEVNPWYQQTKEVSLIQDQNVRVEAWAPFAEGKDSIFSNPLLAEIANNHAKTGAQVILRWLLQRDISVLAKSTHRARIEANIDVFDFTLSDEEMNQITQLDKHVSQFFDHRDPATIEQIFGSSLKEAQESR